MRILLAGDDEVAFRLANALMHEHEVSFVCADRAVHEARLAGLQVQPVWGSPTSASVLRDADVASTDMFVGCSPIDERNLVACITAKRLGAKRAICFAFGQGLAIDDDDSPLTDTLDIDLIVRPAQQLTDEILRIVAVPGALDVESFVGGRVQLLRHAVVEGSAIAAGPLKDVGVPPGVVFVMARRGDEIFLPRGDTEFEPGDKLTVMGNVAGINRLLFGHLRNEEREERRHEAMVIGGGTVGLGVALGLEEAGWRVRVIESSRARCEAIAPRLKGLVLHGDGADMDLLESERVGEVPVLIAVTSKDEKNLLVSLLAKRLGVGRIITRADSHSNERLFEHVGVDVVRSGRGAAIQRVLASVGVTPRELLAELEHGEAAVIELTLPAELNPLPLMAMKAGVFGIIGAILRRGRVIIPRGDDTVEGGDRVLVFCTKTDEEAVRAFFTEGILERSSESA